MAEYPPMSEVLAALEHVEYLVDSLQGAVEIAREAADAAKREGTL